MPPVDTTAAIAGGLAGLGLLITAAGFATRRQRSGHSRLTELRRRGRDGAPFAVVATPT